MQPALRAVSSRLAIALTPFFCLLAHCSSSNSGSGFDPNSSGGASGGASGGVGASSGFGASGGTPDAGQQEFECDKLDLIFVVDDSGSMKEEQTNLASNFPKFVSLLDKAVSKKGAPINYRLAVTTTGKTIKYNQELPPIFGGGVIPMDEKGDNGAFRMKTECGSTKRWLEKGAAGLATNFGCLAKVGTGGPAYEMPLEALRLALEDRMTDGTNAGFLRSDALLGVVILTDEDDCSRSDNNFTIPSADCKDIPGNRPISDYVTALNAAAQGSGRWAASVIAGTGPGKCTSSFGDAVEASRLKDFVAAAGSNGTTSSICSGDLTTALQKTLDSFDGACKRLPPPVPK